MKTAGRCVDDMVIKNPVAMKCALGENPKKYYSQKGMAPITRMGIAGILRDALAEARDYMWRKEAAGDDLLKCPASVSYTHLDVYKRQERRSQQ